MSVNIYNPTTGDLTTVADSIDSLEKVSALPSATTDLIGKVYLLIDEQTGYKKGGIYECQAVEITPIGTEDPSEEGWYELSGSDYVLSADTTVDSSKTYYTIDWVLISSSGDTNIFNGTLAEWEALTAEEQANYSHVATPEEADITGSYSTTETKTGATWIDGKPIYRKCCVLTSSITVSRSNEWQNLISKSTYGLTDIELITSSTIIRNAHKGTCNGLSIGRGGGNYIQVHSEYTEWVLDIGSVIILEYTKTTDD